MRYFNPRSPRGERLIQHDQAVGTIEISIHALREESDERTLTEYILQLHFNPRSPRGERQFPKHRGRVNILNFNPRSPRGERLSLPY